MTRFVAKHSLAVSVVLIILVYLLGIVLGVYLGGLLAYACILVGVCLAVRWGANRGNALLQAPMQVLQDQCDPYPYLEEARRQRDYSGVPMVKLMQCIHEACALHNVGESSQAYRMLVSVGPKYLRWVNRSMRAYYYYWLLCLSVREENGKATEMWYSKMKESTAKVRGQKAKMFVAQLEKSVQLPIHLVRNEYDLALRALQSGTNTNRYGQVNNAWHYGKIYLAQGELAKAKEKLEFVVQNGNRLHVVTLAGALLAQINTTEEM